MTITPENLGTSNEGDGDVDGATTTTKKKKAPSLLNIIARIRYRNMVHVFAAFLALSLLWLFPAFLVVAHKTLGKIVAPWSSSGCLGHHCVVVFEPIVCSLCCMG